MSARISKHISLKEATRSNTAQRLGIDNFPTNDVLIKMQLIANKIFEPLREYVDCPIYISSFYRSPELNTAIGGSKNSQHCKGEAIDLDDVYSKVKNKVFFNYIKENLDFDQLIWEFGDEQNPAWVHVSYKEKGNRNRILKAIKEKGKTKYINKGGKLTNDKTDHPASYILLTGTSANKQREIEALRSDKNKDGEVVKVIIGSPTVAEGLDFKRIREVHIMDPWYNLNKIEQIIGRGIRFCSHKDLEPIFRNVTVYLHAGYMKNKESIDIHIYKNAEIKAKEMGDVEKILKESAVDCYLNKQINHIKDSDVDKIEYVSSQNNKKEILPSDKPNTKICSFNASCDIKCQNESSISNNNSSTTNYDLLIDIIKKIERIIKRLFYERNIPFISFEDIKLELEKNYQHYNDDDNMILKKTLVYMIKNKTEVINNENTKGYLVSRSNDDQIYLLFQPKQEKDENISLYRRRTQKTPVKFTNCLSRNDAALSELCAHRKRAPHP